MLSNTISNLKSTKKIKSSPPSGGRGVYLCIGLNYIDPKHYGTEGKLKACNTDAIDISSIAKSSGFDPYLNGGLLLNEAATRDNVKSSIEEISKYLGPNDFFLLSYSGHGGQVPDLSGDERDGKDETWCLFDGQLIDDELQFLLSKFSRGTRILILSDSCHSGTVDRALMTKAAVSVALVGTENILSMMEPENTPRFRTLSDLTLENTFNSNKEFYKEIIRISDEQNGGGDNLAVQASVALISGCQDNQLSLDGDNNGLFTSSLKTVWNNGSFNGNYIQFHKKIVKRMPPYQTPNFDYYGDEVDHFMKMSPFKI